MKSFKYCVVTLIIGLCIVLAGCGTTNAQRKTTGGVALGALAGGLLGGSKGAVVGSAIGGVSGYAIGTEQDRHKEKMELERERIALEKSKVTSDPKTAYRPPNKNPLVGSTWRVISIVSKEPYPEYHSMVVTFQTNNKLTTLAVLKDGSTPTYVESYRVVDDALVISGKEDGKDYVVNGKYSIEGKQMIYVAPEYRIVLEEIEEKI
jgi:hypothetical protein